MVAVRHANSSLAAQLTALTGQPWRAVREGFGWSWVCEDGRTARQCAESVLGWDGYSDTEFAIWVIDDQGARLLYLGIRIYA